MLENSARVVPDRTAVVLGVQRLTYAELDTAARRVANLLRSRGIEPGDKVALSCPNLPWFPIVYYGILKAGAVVVPLNVLLKSTCCSRAGRSPTTWPARRPRPTSASRAARNDRSYRRAGPASVRLRAARTSS
ncbi:AMP-binding protein [Streptomyces mirabilis]|uniref:AMP-binding protein n=1 Tax=Streptomyces mirabilis TaxID=68239 RepID=UPI0034E93D9C